MASKSSSPLLTEYEAFSDANPRSSIASRIGLDLLKKGYTLRGTLRNQNHADGLVNGAYNTWRDRVQIVIVSNMIADGAFDEAVKGKVIIHPPTSFLLHLDFASALIRPLFALFGRRLISQPLKPKPLFFSFTKVINARSSQ